ncbi:MAG: response regulator transcription factor [Sphingomonas sp.]|uniref:LytR/AlgR family response regulator transcription factor n=1 Tax=Sphingomonas sp. TaxID=28214 RepID=UPI0017E62C62|nr:LytTR family DNA-binding domain-containing protein [Sphingomonas sp.]MBA3666639.1 response regulator transcription factor [Sphingomonas sp.]
MTTSLRVLVYDEEPLAVDRLSGMLSRCAGVEVVARTRSVGEALSQIVALSPNLLLLDIGMPGLHGFNIAKQFGQLVDGSRAPPLVVFVSAFPAFAVHAFDTGALDFLAKPVRRSRLEVALTRARTALEARESVIRFGEIKLALEVLRNQHRHPDFESDHLWIPRRGEFVRVDFNQIDWIQAEGGYVRLYTGNSTHLYREMIGSFSNKLNPQKFVRIHRSYIVRQDYVTSVRRSIHGRTIVRFASGDELPVGRKYSRAARTTFFHSSERGRQEAQSRVYNPSNIN